MHTEYFWQDLWLRFWWDSSKAPVIVSIFFLLGAILCLSIVFKDHFSGFDFPNIYNLIVGSFCFILFVGTLLSGWIYPYVYENSPNTTLKEEIRTASIVPGSTVWVIKRDADNKPIDVEAHIVFLKKTNSVVVDQSLANEHTPSPDSSTVLIDIPISDCHTTEEDAHAAIAAELSQIGESQWQRM